MTAVYSSTTLNVVADGHPRDSKASGTKLHHGFGRPGRAWPGMAAIWVSKSLSFRRFTRFAEARACGISLKVSTVEKARRL